MDLKEMTEAMLWAWGGGFLFALMLRVSLTRLALLILDEPLVPVAVSAVVGLLALSLGAPGGVLAALPDLIRGAVYLSRRRVARRKDPVTEAMLRMMRSPEGILNLVMALFGRSPTAPGLLGGRPIGVLDGVEVGHDHIRIERALAGLTATDPALGGLLMAIYRAGKEDAELVASMLSGYVSSAVGPKLMARIIAGGVVSLLIALMLDIALFILYRLPGF